MKILFINPNIDVGGYKPLGISVLIAVAKKLNHNVRIFDTSFYDVEEYTFNKFFIGTKQVGEEVLNFVPVDLSDYNISKEKVDLQKTFIDVINNFKPDIVALSIFSQEYALGMYLLNLVKKVKADTLTIVGGIHCYADPESVINDKNVDFICVGEGENAFRNWLRSVEDGGDFCDIKGLWYKKDAKCARNCPDEYVNLNSLPYLDYDEYDDRLFIRAFNGKVYRSADVSLTRGCFEKCIYCLHDKMCQIYGSSKIRRYDVDRFISELEYLIQLHNINFIRFQDSTFLSVSEKYLAEFARQYINRVGLPFVIDSTPQNVTYGKLKYLKEMNCQSIDIGVETGSEQYRMEYLNKKVTNRQIIDAFKIVNGFNIRTVAFVLLGFPFETREITFETIKLIREAKVSAPNVGFVYPFVGSKLREIVTEQHLFEPSIEINNSPQYSRNHPVIRNPNISKDEYAGIYRTFLFYCKFPDKYYGDIRIAEKFDKRGNSMFAKLKEIYVKNELYNSYL